MSRRDRLGASWLDELTAGGRVPTASVVASLYRQWRAASSALEWLARAITNRRYAKGLRALRAACASVRVVGELVEVVERISSDPASAGMAQRLRTALLAEIHPWIEEARRELPHAARVLCTFVTDPKAREATAAALRQLGDPPKPKPRGSR